MYRAQRRGGKGKAATSMKEEDVIDKLFVASTHDTILCFSSRGKVYWMKVYDLPQASRIARGKPMVNLLPLEEGERINAILPVREYEAGKYVFMATSSGIVKKTSLEEFSRPRTNGIIAVELLGDDRLVGVDITDGTKDVMLFASSGKAVRFNENDVRPMGRTARGVRGITLGTGQQVISLIIAASPHNNVASPQGDAATQGDVLTATERGYGKRTATSDYPVHGRGGQGVISIQTSGRNGNVIGAVLVNHEDEIMLISDGGTLVRTRVSEISVLGRNTQGVKLISLDDSEKLVVVEKVASIAEEAAVGTVEPTPE